jgi:hypothetical protein
VLLEVNFAWFTSSPALSAAYVKKNLPHLGLLRPDLYNCVNDNKCHQSYDYCTNHSNQCNHPKGDFAVKDRKPYKIFLIQAGGFNYEQEASGCSGMYSNFSGSAHLLQPKVNAA